MMRTSLRPPQARLTQNICSLAIVYTLAVNTPRKARAEDSIDFKTMYYMEDKDRIKVFSPTVALQRELTPALSIRIDGIYNSISGATPTGAPMVITPAQSSQSTTAGTTPVAPPVTPIIVRPPPPTDDDESDDRRLRYRSAARSIMSTRALATPFNAVTAATPVLPPAPPPQPSTPTPPGQTGTPAPSAPAAGTGSAGQKHIPMAKFSDERYAGNVEFIGKLGRHTPSALFSYSTESDYNSLGIALKNATDFNQKNTTLLLGAAFTHDLIKPANSTAEETKDTIDILAGVTQVLGPNTLWSFNLSRGQTSGFISDPYKVVELNGTLVPERRPDSKDKTIAYTSLTRYIDSLRGSIEGSYRYYQDGFGIDAHTLALAWYQKVGGHFIVRPLLRYYTQSEADFYGVRFTGAPAYYSSDYRVSAFNAIGYGLKLIWMPTSRLSFDVGFERYDQGGTDGITPGDVYTSANIFIVGARIWL